MYRALCSVEARARSGDVEAARDQFFADARDDLHELAATAGQSDRTASARLHEAGYAVEHDFERAPTDMPTGVSTLIIAARDAIVAVGESEPPRCQSIGDK